MTLKELIAEYKGEISVNVKKITDEGCEDTITFKNTEAESIKDSLLASTVGNFTVEVSNKVPATATLTVVVRETVTTDTDGNKSGTTDSGAGSTTTDSSSSSSTGTDPSTTSP